MKSLVIQSPRRVLTITLSTFLYRQTMVNDGVFYEEMTVTHKRSTMLFSLDRNMSHEAFCFGSTPFIWFLACVLRLPCKKDFRNYSNVFLGN